MVTGACKAPKIGNASGSWVVREVLPEAVIFNLQFSDKKKTGS